MFELAFRSQPAGRAYFLQEMRRFRYVGTELFYQATSMWADTGSVLTGREFHTATLLASGQVLGSRWRGNRVNSGEFRTLPSGYR